MVAHVQARPNCSVVKVENLNQVASKRRQAVTPPEKRNSPSGLFYNFPPVNTAMGNGGGGNKDKKPVKNKPNPSQSAAGHRGTADGYNGSTAWRGAWHGAWCGTWRGKRGAWRDAWHGAWCGTWRDSRNGARSKASITTVLLCLLGFF